MIRNVQRRAAALGLVIAALAVPVEAPAQDEDAVSGGLGQGGYLAPMATYLLPQADRLDSGLGGTLALGYRGGRWAIEIAGLLVEEKADGSETPDLAGGALNGLYFPSTALPHLYGIATIGGASLDHYPIE
ncbi:MAG TPA: hypothetical protein VJM11_20925 [Nevskiaceae bacterium]|nr:hypothetical protein [Nevskiaceae bacterium]